MNDLKTLLVKEPLKLDCGKTIKDFPIAYETYGQLNENKDNAILVFHALTGDQFVICANVIGGCMGSYGPSFKDPATDKVIGTDFPVITINDMVNAQVSLLDYFNIKKLFFSCWWINGWNASFTICK